MDKIIIMTFEVVFSSVQLGITLLPLCAFGLYVAIVCQHETLSPLEDSRGGRAMSRGLETALILSASLRVDWSRSGRDV